MWGKWVGFPVRRWIELWGEEKNNFLEKVLAFCPEVICPLCVKKENVKNFNQDFGHYIHTPYTRVPQKCDKDVLIAQEGTITPVI